MLVSVLLVEIEASLVEFWQWWKLEVQSDGL